MTANNWNWHVFLLVMKGIGWLETHLRSLTIFKPLTQVFLPWRKSEDGSNKTKRSNYFAKLDCIFLLFCSYSLIVFHGVKDHETFKELFYFETFLKLPLQKFSKGISTWGCVIVSDQINFYILIYWFYPKISVAEVLITHIILWWSELNWLINTHLHRKRAWIYNWSSFPLWLSKIRLENLKHDFFLSAQVFFFFFF